MNNLSVGEHIYATFLVDFNVKITYEMFYGIERFESVKRLLYSHKLRKLCENIDNRWYKKILKLCKNKEEKHDEYDLIEFLMIMN